MRCDLTRLAGDPTYAPGIVKAKNLFYWRPPASSVKAGYNITNVRLIGHEGDGQELARALRCREMERDMLRWIDAQNEPRVMPGTWHWLIASYKSDDLSPYREVKSNTAQTYLYCLDKWQEAIGATRIVDTDYMAIRRWQKAMEDNGRSSAYTRRMFTMLRIVAGYGVMIKAAGAKDVRDILGEMRFRSQRPNKSAPKSGELMAIIAAADKDGQHGFALGLSLQWWLTLRAVDVRGQWLGQGAARRWADGLTWDMIDGTVIRKIISKTARSRPEAMQWDVGPIQDIVSRLAAIPADQRVGPVVRMNNGKPFERRHWSALFRKYARQCGVSDAICAMDTRSGAINHAKGLGASPLQLQAMAQHADLSTTQIYIRDQVETAAQVIELRRDAK
jgi:hypothetical protein